MRERKPNRLKNYDYSRNGSYFVTICTKDRINYFGNIKSRKMVLNEYGKIVKQQWLWLQEQYDYVYLDEYTIMPNHMHGILTIDNKNNSDPPEMLNRPVYPSLRRQNALS